MIGKWFDSVGGLKRNEEEKNKVDHAENNFLNAYNYWKLTGDEKVKKDLIVFLDKVIKEDPVTGKPYMVNHFAPEVLKGEGELSHDQLEAYVMASKDFGTNHHKMVWNDFKWTKYNGRKFKIRTVATIGMINGDWKGYALIPLIILPLFWSYFFKYAIRIKPDLKGKQVTRQLRVWTVRGFIKNSEPRLWLLRRYFLPGFLRKFIEMLAKWRFGSINGVYESYFEYNDDHPILKVL